MTFQPPKIYEQLHFSEYLCGGNEKLTLQNWGLLQQDIPSYCRYQPDEQSSHNRASYDKKSISIYSDDTLDDYQDRSRVIPISVASFWDNP